MLNVSYEGPSYHENKYDMPNMQPYMVDQQFGVGRLLRTSMGQSYDGVLAMAHAWPSTPVSAACLQTNHKQVGMCGRIDV
jgi:hypothetical protein